MRFPLAKTAVLAAILIALAAATPASAARYRSGYYRYRGGYYGYRGDYGYRGYYGNRGYYAPYYGYGYAPGYVYSQGYVLPEGYVQAPGISTQSFYPSNLNTTPTDAAVVRVQCPSNAQIWFDGEATTQTGGQRSYSSPSLQPGKEYEYHVKARWNDNGKPVEQTRTVTVAAGRTSNLDFNAPETKVTR